MTSGDGRRRSATLRLELFVDDLTTSLDFYVRVLGFVRAAERPGGYTPLARDSVRLALNRRSDLPEGHLIQRAVRDRCLGCGA